MLSGKEFRQYDEDLNRTIDVLTEVSTAVRHAYPPDDRIHSIVRTASDAISGLQEMRTELEQLWLKEHTPPNPTDMDALFQRLIQRVLGLDGVEAFNRESDGSVGFKAPKLMRTQFLSVYQHLKHVTLYLKMPFDNITDPHEMCEKKDYGWTVVKLKSVENLDYVMGLVQQVYDFNLIGRS